MKVIVTSEGKGLDSKVDQRFGRCGFFMLVDTDTMEYKVLDNIAASQGGGAGVKAAQIVIDNGAKAVLTGNCGPNSYEVLKSGGIDIIVGVSGTVREAIETFKEGKLNVEGDGPNVSSHHGLT